MTGRDAPGWSRTGKIGLIAIFFALLAAGMAGATVLTTDETFENRALAAWPKLDVTSVADEKFLKTFTKAVRDRHGLREDAIIARNTFKYRVFGDKESNELTYGADGWLFMKGAAWANCHRKASSEWVASHLRRYLALTRPGQEQHVVIFPDKEFVYLDRAVEQPNWARQQFAALWANVAPASASADKIGKPGPARGDHHACSVRKYGEDIDYIAQKIGGKLLDIRAPITELARATKSQIYFDQDTHWTFETSAWAGGRILEKISPGIWRVEHLSATPSVVRVQDLSRMAGIPSLMTSLNMSSQRPGVIQVKYDPSLRYSPRQPVYKYQYRTNDVTSPLIKGRTVIVYDSFMIPNLGVISPYFEDVTWLFWDDFERPEAQRLIKSADRLVMASVYRLFPRRVELMSKMTRPNQ